MSRSSKTRAALPSPFVERTMRPQDATSGGHQCRKVRLAQGSVATVDRCDCGVMHLQLGVLTLRLCPEALSDLLATLGRAVAADAGHRTREDLELAGPSLSPIVTGRGHA